MWASGKNSAAGRGCYTPQPRPTQRRVSRQSPMSERKTVRMTGDLFHVIHKVPPGDSPYVKAKRVQLIDKDPGKSIGLFWAAINAGDRVDSALKDMAIVMKQLNRSDEAIEAIKSFRHLCPLDSQESLDNVLIELYKRSGRIEEEIVMLQEKLKNIEERKCLSGGRLKMARSQGKKIQVTVDEERSRIMGNLAWANVQLNNFETAERLYGEALFLKPDKNKQCNLAMCLMHLNRVSEAKTILQVVRSSSPVDGDGETDESYMKSFERALQMLNELDSSSTQPEGDKNGAPNYFTPSDSPNAAVSRAISHGYWGEGTCVEHEGKRWMGLLSGTNDGENLNTVAVDSRRKTISPFERPKRQSSTVGEANSGRKTLNAASRAPVRRNIIFSLTEPKVLSEGYKNSMQGRNHFGSHALQLKGAEIEGNLRNGASLLPNRAQRDQMETVSTPLLNEYGRYMILGSDEQSELNGRSNGHAVRNGALEKDREDYSMSGEGKWIRYSVMEAGNCADTARSLEKSTNEKEEILAPWFVRDKEKKSWADIAEEEEEEDDWYSQRPGFTVHEHHESLPQAVPSVPSPVLHPTKENFIEEYIDEDNENMDTNIIHQCEGQVKNLSRKVALFSLEDSLKTSEIKTVPSKNPSVRRSLKFDSDEPSQGHGGLSDYYSIEAEIQEEKQQRPRKRLQVFRDITRLHHTA